MTVLEAKMAYPSFEINDIEEDDTSIIVYMKSKSCSATCPYCGTISDKRHLKKPKKIEDIPFDNKHVFLIINSVCYKCINPECSIVGFIEKIDSIPTGERKTQRLIDFIMQKYAETKSIRKTEEYFKSIGYSVCNSSVSNISIKSRV